jgi:hypothetical protein
MLGPLGKWVKLEAGLVSNTDISPVKGDSRSLVRTFLFQVKKSRRMFILKLSIVYLNILPSLLLLFSKMSHFSHNPFDGGPIPPTRDLQDDEISTSPSVVNGGGDATTTVVREFLDELFDGASVDSQTTSEDPNAQDSEEPSTPELANRSRTIKDTVDTLLAPLEGGDVEDRLKAYGLRKDTLDHLLEDDVPDGLPSVDYVSIRLKHALGQKFSDREKLLIKQFDIGVDIVDPSIFCKFKSFLQDHWNRSMEDLQPKMQELKQSLAEKTVDLPLDSLFVSNSDGTQYQSIVDLIGVVVCCATATTATQISVTLLSYITRNVPERVHREAIQFVTAMFNETFSEEYSEMENQGFVVDALTSLRDFCNLSRQSTGSAEKVPVVKAFRSWMGVLSCFGMISNDYSLTVNDMKLIETKWNNRESTSLMGIIDVVLESIEYSLDVALVWEKKGLSQELFVPRDVLLDHTQLMSQCEYALIGSERHLGCTLVEFHDKLRSHADTLNKLVKISVGAERSLYARSLAEVESKAVKLNIKLWSCDIVAQAYTFVFSGKPGTGKSFATRVATAAVLDVAGAVEPGADKPRPLAVGDPRVAIVTRSRYDDTITNQTEILIGDDMAAKKPEKEGADDIAPGQFLIEKVNNVQQAAIKAAVDEKGKTFPVIKGVGITTNVPSLNLNVTHHCPDAPVRRINISAEIVSNPHCRTKTGGVDTAAYRKMCSIAAAEGRPKPHPNYFRIYEMRFANGKFCPKTIATMAPPKFFEFLHSDIRKHFADQKTYIDNMSQELVFKDGKLNIYHSDYEEKINQSSLSLWDTTQLMALDQILYMVPSIELGDWFFRWLFKQTGSSNKTIYARIVIVFLLGYFIPIFVCFWHYRTRVETIFLAAFYLVFFVNGVIDYIKRRIAEAVIKRVFETKKGVSDFFDSLNVRRYGAIAAALVGLASIYKLMSLTYQNQSVLNPKTADEVEERRNQPNHWENYVVKREPVPTSPNVLGADLEEVILKNQRNFFRVDTCSKGDVLKDISGAEHLAYMPVTGVILVPKHWWIDRARRFGENCRIYLYRIATNETTPAYVKNFRTYDDIAELAVTSSPIVSDTEEYYAAEPYKEGAAILFNPKDGTRRKFKWVYTPRAKGGNGAVYPGSEHKYDVKTSTGDCMSIAISASKPHVVLGFHLAGGRFTSAGTCGIPRSVSMEYQSFQLPPTKSGDFPTSVFGKSVYEPEEPHPNAVINFASTAENLQIDDPIVRTVVPDPQKMIGENDPQVQNYGGRLTKARQGKSCVKDTELSPYLEEAGRENKWGPPSVPHNLVYAQNFATVCHPMTQFDPGAIAWAIKDYLTPLLDPEKRSIYGIARPLTDDEVVNGVPECKFVKGMNMDTAPGVGLTGKKKDHFHAEVNPATGAIRYQPRDYIESQVESDDLKLKNGIRTNPMSKTSIKDEPTKKTKNKSRIFNVLPLTFLMLGRKYLQWIVDYFYTFPIISEMAVGVQCNNDEWKQLYEHLSGSDTGESYIWSNQVMEGDYSNYDQRITTQLLDAVSIIFVEMAIFFSFSAESVRAIISWFADLARPYVNFNGVLLSFFGFNLSGNNITIVINNLVNALLFRMFYYDYHVNVLRRNPCDIPPFRVHVRALFVGDDSLAATDFNWFNMVNFQVFLKHYGMPYTDANKSSTTIPFYNIHEVSFCKRKFRPEGGRVYAPIELDSIYKRMHCWMDRGKVHERDVLGPNVDQALIELARHPQEVFDFESRIIYSALEKSGLCVDCKYYGKPFPYLRAIVDGYYDGDDSDDHLTTIDEASDEDSS